ncbi:MAG TPA: LPS-assembly protein LptD [Pseudolabrys sp.]|nr:LPS-assembly protein LptD [Pseudolabrys sp.]
MARLPTARPVPIGRASRRRWRFALVLAFACGAAWLVPASGQVLKFPQRPSPAQKSQTTINRQNSGKSQMLVQAREIDYDYTNNRVSAVGNVQIYYNGATLEADKVTYDEKTKRLRAEGNARLTEPDGKVTYGQIMDLSDDYRNGFVDSLRLDTPEQTRMAAARAERSSGNFTIFHNGVYTACAPCRDDPRKPPLWQVKAARIIHDQNEKMIYFEDASLEFFGKPIAYLPYFSAPDPTVKRKSGLLIPTVGFNSIYGTSATIPYYWALAPNYDATFAPMITTRQGLLPQAEYRQRFENGALAIRGAGIYQLDPNAFDAGAPGHRKWRGAIESSGQFALNDKWVWGWDGIAVSDKQFLNDYRPNLMHYSPSGDPFQPGINEGISQAYLSGKGDRSYFDVRSIYYYGFSTADVQKELPIIHPVLDYNRTLGQPILGGELSYKVNLTSLSRATADFDAISATALANGTCVQTADPAVKTTANCLLRGVPGTYTRFSAESTWRRTITDSFGQMFTPFVQLRADAASMEIKNEPGVSNYIQTGDDNLVRAMPAVGLEYRYPFISVESWGTQTIEPIAQVIFRPNETEIGRFPNEDSQTLIFDDSNLFRVNKFSGWDRVEGGSRANVGAQYTAQVNQAGFFNVLFGQSYSLFGRNSFAVGGLTNTGIESGLDTASSDYVGRISYQPNSTYTFTSRFRFDHNNFSAERTELEARANFDRWSTSLLYGDYAAQPELGFLSRRQGVLGNVSFKLDANWVLSAGARYDLNAAKFDQTRIGLGYVDDCLIFGLNYITGYSYDVVGSPTLVHQVMLQLSLRTLGGTTVSENVNGVGSH